MAQVYHLTPHFTEDEMKCPCCGLCAMEGRFMMELERFRGIIGHPLTVTSGMRCAAHNATLPNAASNSWHVWGKAVDLAWTPDKLNMLRSALNVFDGIGIGSDFLHLDLGGMPKLWIY